MAKKTKLPDVRVGQTWIDNDPRHQQAPRSLKVVKVHRAKGKVEAYAECDVYGRGVPRRVKVMLRRFKPTSTGYRMQEATEVRGPGIIPLPPGTTIDNLAIRGKPITTDDAYINTTDGLS